MLRAALTLIVVLAAGCNSLPSWLGGDSAEGKAPSGAGSNSPDGNYTKRRVIVAFGDSLTAGFGVDPGESYPDHLQRELDQRGYDYHVVNEGVSGDTSDGGLVRTAIVAARNPDFVILAFGGNDGLRVLPVDRMRRNLRRTITRLQKRGIQVILCGMKLPPNYGQDYRDEFEKTFPELAEELGVPLLPFLLEGVADKPELMQHDSIHPNEEGNEIIASSVMEILEPLLLAAQRDAAP